MYSNGRQKLINQLRLMLGSQMVDVELDQEHYELSISLAIERIRQRSDGALEEEDIFITIQPDIQEYKLPDEVQEVRRLYRRGVGAYTSGGMNFDPVDGSFFNIYLMQPKRSGGLSTWDLFNSYLETTERMFASQFNFVWYNSTKTLRIIRKPRSIEDVMVRVWTTKSEETLFTDPYTGPWIRSYALAQCKGMLGQARDKFPSGFPGPNGTVIFNGAQLVDQSIQELEKLDKELDEIYTGGDGYSFVIG